ncbi:hypothetical protein B0H15DRAFT_811196 [Mycena belliarum]|uniref:Uncharacterized protein n=1 Tax=Mycena belliarum TaxID=1033014 RepID=A0AAD6ULG2_9AGAR|nr:hypothetical protein B0H15DRAFT_811196 [Mycena belliae]
MESFQLKQEPDQDVDMDAPLISTLHQEDSPPPPPRRVKLLVKDTRATASQSSSSRKRAALSDDDELDEEDEEDQLIDDDDVVPPVVVPPAAPPSAPADSSSKRKAPSKRKPRKSEKKIAEEERKSKEKIMQAGAPSLAPTMTWFEVQATKAHQHVGVSQMGTLDVGHVPPLNIVSLDPGPSKPPPKKKVARKPPAVPRVRAKPGPKPKAVLLPVPPEDTDVISEAGYSVTAASSPVTAHLEANTPEPEVFPPYTNGPLVEEPPVNLQEVPLPQYPLPVKPFSVQPPQKINTGFAPVLPLDRTAAKVRHWRVVNREIRGIAGGRWFTRSWVGQKESALAVAIAAGDRQSSSVALPKLPAMSISAPASSKPKAARATKNSSLAASAAPSRSSSTVPSKMRTIMLAPSDGGDSDMVPATGS